MRAWWALVLVASFLAPTAAATVTIHDVVLPERTMAGKPFPVSLTLANGENVARRVFLFAALYDKVEGEGPCGSSADPRFDTFTHLVQETIDVPAGASVPYPDADDTWLHLYREEHVDPSPEIAEFCLFVANASAARQMIDYESFSSLDLSVRGVNAAPTASFTWHPETPEATEDVRFEAEGDDADGDPVTFAWDFGHVNTSGRARATGATPTTFFFPPAEYTVTLTASDGLEETPVARTITIVPETADAPDDGFDIPLPALVALAALAIAARRRR